MHTLDAGVERLATFLGQVTRFAVLLLWFFSKLALGVLLFGLIYVAIPMYVVRHHQGPVRFLPFMLGFGLYIGLLVAASSGGVKVYDWLKQRRAPKT
ncbi:MAG TPA: hypothetical protein VFW04_12265 [Gemmatimonadaceae bacterium]|nr:hypothetical protein [Gemmatimonadaceae bacterium]